MSSSASSTRLSTRSPGNGANGSGSGIGVMADRTWICCPLHRAAGDRRASLTPQPKPVGPGMIRAGAQGDESRA